MKKLIKTLAVCAAAMCLFGCTNPVEEETKKTENFEVDLTHLVEKSVLDFNLWGGRDYSRFQDDAGIDITSELNGKLPKEGDTLHIKWNGKSDTDIEKLHIIVADTTEWKHLFPEEKVYDTPVAKKIKADTEFSVDITLPIGYNAEKEVKVFFCCGENDMIGPATLYTGDKPETLAKKKYLSPGLKLEGETVKLSSPGEDYLAVLKDNTKTDDNGNPDPNCNGYLIGITCGKTDDGYDKWIFSRKVLFTDSNAFQDIDFSEDFIKHISELKGNKIKVKMDYYSNIQNDEEKIWRFHEYTDDITYSPSENIKGPELSIDGFTVKVTTPNEKYLNILKKDRCNGYILGVASGRDENGAKWLTGKTIKLTDEKSFKDNDFTLELLRAYSKIEKGKIFPVLDFYENIENENERKWLFRIEGTEIIFPQDKNLKFPQVKLEHNIVKIEPPSENFKNLLKTINCDGYFIGIAPEIDSEWLFGDKILLTDEKAFKDFDFTNNFNSAVSENKINSKVKPVISFYKDIDKSENERIYLFDVKGSEVNYQ